MAIENGEICVEDVLNLVLVAVVTLAASATLYAFSLVDQKSATSPEVIAIAYAAHPQSAIAQIAEVRGYFREQGLRQARINLPLEKPR